MLANGTMMNEIKLTNTRKPAEKQGNIRRQLIQEFADLLREQPQLFRLTLNEAEGLASLTPYPELMLPVLAQEKLQQLAAWNAHQKRVRAKTEQEFALAA